MEFDGFPLKQGEMTFYMGKMKVKDLLEFKPDVWGLSNPRGYQRDVSERRAKDFASFVRNKGTSPVSILLSVRGESMITAQDGKVSVSDAAPKYIADGQHRRRGLELLVVDDPRYSEMETPVIVMNPPNRYEEAKQFLIINRTQKGIRADLAERILQQAMQEEGRERLIHQREHGVLRALYKNVEWSTKSLKVADILNGGLLSDGSPLPSPWEGRIWLPNEPRGGRSVSQKAFTESLDPVVKAEFLSAENEDFVAKVVVNYWTAIKNLCPQAFDTPEQYVIQKTSGVAVLNAILPDVARYTQDDTGRKDLRVPALEGVLRNLGAERLSAGYWQTNGTVALRGTSKGSFGLLIQEFREALAEVSVPEKRTDIII